MASRWCAIISACQTSPTAIMLIATTHTAITKVFCVSEAGMWRQRAIQAIVRGLLVLGPHAVNPTRVLPGRRDVASAIVRATKWPVRMSEDTRIVFENQQVARVGTKFRNCRHDSLVQDGQSTVHFFQWHLGFAAQRLNNALPNVRCVERHLSKSRGQAVLSDRDGVSRAGAVHQQEAAIARLQQL